MRTTQPYFIRVSMEVNKENDLKKNVYCKCKWCSAGNEPAASCKHVAAFFYALEEFVRLGYTRPPLTRTEEFQTRNHPWKRKAQVQLAEETDGVWAKIPSGQAKKRSNRLLYARRHKDDMGKVATRMETVVNTACTTGRLSGLLLLTCNLATMNLINQKLHDKRLCRTKV